MNKDNLPRTQIFEPGDEVFFVIGDSDYDGVVVEDDGGLEVVIDVDRLGRWPVYHTLLKLKGE